MSVADRHQVAAPISTNETRYPIIGVEVITPIMKHSSSSGKNSLAKEANSSAESSLPSILTPNSCSKPARPLRRSNSERSKKYRKKKKAYVVHLAEEVEALQWKVLELYDTKRQLSRQQRAFASPITATGSAVQFALEYYNIFRYGLAGRQHLDGRAITPPIQRDYLASFIHPLVKFGGLTGLDALMGQWANFTNFHASYCLEFKAAHLTMMDDCALITTTGVAHLRYSRTTIYNVYPHVVGNEVLAQRLIGKEIHLPFTDHFWFNSDGKLTRYEVYADFVTALMEALGELNDVAVLLQDARMDQGTLMGPTATDRKSEKTPSMTTSEDSDASINATATKVCKSAASPTPSANSTMGIEYILS